MCFPSRGAVFIAATEVVISVIISFELQAGLLFLQGLFFLKRLAPAAQAGLHETEQLVMCLLSHTVTTLRALRALTLLACVGILVPFFPHPLISPLKLMQLRSARWLCE